jgi:hypothetical protein
MAPPASTVTDATQAVAPWPFGEGASEGCGGTQNTADASAWSGGAEAAIDASAWRVPDDARRPDR